MASELSSVDFAGAAASDLEALRAANAELRTVNHGLEDVLKRHRAGEPTEVPPILAAAIAEADRLSDAVEAQDVEIERLTTELADLNAEKLTIDAGIAHANETIDAKSRALAEIHSSLAWKLLARVRAAASFLRRH